MTRSRRLLMIVHGPYPRMEPRVEREAAAALAAGWQVDVIAMRLAGEPDEETTAAGVRVFRLDRDRTRRASAFDVVREYVGFTLAAASAVARLDRQNRYAVVQVHNPPDFLLFAAMWPRLRGARLVFDVHDFAPELFELRFGGRRLGRLAVAALSAVEWIALRAAHVVVTVHEPYRRAIAARGIPLDKIVVALNSPDERLLPTGSAPRDGTGFRVVYHGTVTARYGLTTLMDAVARVRGAIPGIAVEIYGAGDGLAEVVARADELGIADLVRFSDGFVDARVVLEQVAGADVGVIANLAIARNQQAIPTKLFEYAALAVPVIATRLDAVAEHFDDDEVLFVPAGDADALAAALVETAANPAAAARRAVRARRRYESYRWSESSKEYVGMLDRISGGSVAPAAIDSGSRPPIPAPSATGR